MSDLTELAIKLAQSTRDELDDVLVSLDTEIAQSNAKIKDLDAERSRENDKYNFLHRKSGVVLDIQSRLVDRVRDLKRPREGWPWLSDDEYAMKVADTRQEVQELVELSERSVES